MFDVVVCTFENKKKTLWHSCWKPVEKHFFHWEPVYYRAQKFAETYYGSRLIISEICGGKLDTAVS